MKAVGRSVAAARASVAGACTCALAACGSAAKTGDALSGSVIFTVTADSLIGPGLARAGYATLTFANRSDSLMAHALVRIRKGVTADSGLRAVRIFHGLEKGDRAAAMTTIDGFYGGAVFVRPGESKQVSVMLAPGHYVSYADVVSDDEPRVHHGFVTPLEVRASEHVASAPPVPDHTIRMLDFRFASPSKVKAGRSRWRVANAGKSVHLAFIGRLLPGRSYADAKAWLTNPAGPSPIEETERTLGVHGLSPGLYNDVELDLRAGEYVLVCVIEGHHTMGMIHPLRVMD